MKQVMEHYGNAILTMVVLLALGVILVAALKTDGFVSNQFKSALEGFFTNMNNMVPGVGGGA
ncbi:MAG: hypothetical protein HDQ95_16295 [Roseburia sp.]|nr:hypothetical protein [Roseburia sp.]